MRRIAVTVSAMLAAALVGGCTTLDACGRYAPGTMDALHCGFVQGDKAAMLELGKRYEEGRGVKQDYRRAASLYRSAAAFSPGTQFAYLPPVGNMRLGSVIPVRTGADQAGLPEAKYRLALLHLSGRGVKFDVTRGMELLREAADAGFGPAAEELRRREALPAS